MRRARLRDGPCRGLSRCRGDVPGRRSRPRWRRPRQSSCARGGRSCRSRVGRRGPRRCLTLCGLCLGSADRRSEWGGTSPVSSRPRHQRRGGGECGRPPGLPCGMVPVVRDPRVRRGERARDREGRGPVGLLGEVSVPAGVRGVAGVAGVAAHDAVGHGGELSRRSRVPWRRGSQPWSSGTAAEHSRPPSCSRPPDGCPRPHRRRGALWTGRRP